MAGSTARVVAASPFPVSRRSDGLSHIGSDSRWTLQGQGWLNRNHGGAGLLSRLLRSFFFQHLCRSGSPRPKSREGDGLCLFTAHREHKKALECLVVKPTSSSSSPCLARADLVFAFHRGVPFCLAENSFFNKLQHKKPLSGRRKRVSRMEYESHLWLLTLQGYNPPRDPLDSVRVRVRVGQTQAAIPFCVWLLATCGFFRRCCWIAL